MKTFYEYLISEQGIVSPGALPPGGAGGPPSMPPPAGGGSPLGGMGGMGGGPTPPPGGEASNKKPLEISSSNVWDALEKQLGISNNEKQESPKEERKAKQFLQS